MGRVASVVAGALAAASATRVSRWYVTPLFTTFLVFLLLLYAHPQDAGSRFGERVLDTALGVGLAYLYGLLLPTLKSPPRRSRSSRAPPAGTAPPARHPAEPRSPGSPPAS
jgi:uncharacterized membrane protein YccC